MKKISALLICLMITQTTYTKNVIQISMPKAGTHLLRKLLCSLTGVNRVVQAGSTNRPSFYQVELNEFHWKRKNVKHWLTHLFFTKKFEPFLNNDKNAFFFIYRDPRDQLVSFAYYMLKHDYWSKSRTLPFDDLLLSLIQSGEIYNNHPPCDNINSLYQRYMPWFSAPHVCCIRFEDLIGPNGGGNLEAQIDVIKKIADHLDIVVSNERILTITNTLFGGTGTFRKGQIGSWKNHFKEHHIKAFKKVAGQLLINLGYEESFDW